MNAEAIIFVAASIGINILIASGLYWRRSKKERTSIERLQTIQAAGLKIPPTLHPVIDSTRCIGSASCTLACPQGDNVLGLIAGRGALVDHTQCIGHGRCAAECPVDAIRLVFGTSERGVDIPHVKATFETNVPGLFIAGELGGMGLIANAVRQARQAMGNILAAIQVEKNPAEAPGLVDVAIIGAGPAGMGAALAAIEQDMSYKLLEKERDFGGAILHYPRRKLVMTEPLDLPLLGKIKATQMTKEELIELFQHAASEHNVEIENGFEVKDILRNADGTFTITNGETTVHARKVLMSIGRRGTPRRIGVPGEEAQKVAYALLDPELYEGRNVLVVGGGDSAVEAACTLAEETSAKVTMSYRGEAISSARPKNRERLEKLLANEKLTVIWRSNVQEISESAVTLEVDGETRMISNDDVLVFIGGELPTEFLHRTGIKFERHYGEELEIAEHESEDSKKVFSRIQSQAKSKGDLQDLHADGHEHLTWATIWPPVLGFLLLTAIFWFGKDYYMASQAQRDADEALKVFAPTGVWGQTLGVLALLFMITNIAYFFRKEFAIFKGWGNIHTWMHVHVFSGIMAGIVALIHSSMFMRNLFAMSLYISLAIVIVTGLVGRYIYSFVPLDPRGRPLAHGALVSLSERMSREFGNLYHNLTVFTEIHHILDMENQPEQSLWGLPYRLVVFWPKQYIQMRRFIHEAKKEIPDDEKFDEFSHFCREMLKMRFQLDYLKPLKKFLGLWRSSHAALAFFLMILVIVHIVVEFWIGYTWIF